MCLRCLETMTLLKRTFVNPFTLFKATNHVNIVASYLLVNRYRIFRIRSNTVASNTPGNHASPSSSPPVQDFVHHDTLSRALNNKIVHPNPYITTIVPGI